MPCRVDPPYESEKSQARDASVRIASFYMHQGDMLREAVLAEDRNLAATLLKEVAPAMSALPNVNSYGDTAALSAQRDEHRAEFERAFGAAHKFVGGKRYARKALENDQIRHRKVDVKRLIKTFADKGQIDKIRDLLDVDYTKPLEPQIGYDPDKY